MVDRVGVQASGSLHGAVLCPSTAVAVGVERPLNWQLVLQQFGVVPGDCAKKEEAFGGVILKSERPSGALFTNSGPPFFTVESKIEVLSPLGTSFH